MTAHAFFDEQTERSAKKTDIVAKCLQPRSVLASERARFTPSCWNLCGACLLSTTQPRALPTAFCD